MLLTIASGPNVSQDMKIQSIKMASAAITLAQQEMVQLNEQTPMETQPSQTSDPTVSTPQAGTPTQPPVSLVGNFPQASAPVSQARIEIINQSNHHRIEDNHVATTSEGNLDDDNVMDIAAIVYDDNGSIVTTGKIQITTTDSSQDTTTFARNVNGQIYFPFEYIFRTVGDNTVTFSMNGITKSVTVTAK